MILMIWLTSVIVSLAPLMGWKDEKFMERIEAGKCMVRIHSYYQSTIKYKIAVFLLIRSAKTKLFRTTLLLKYINFYFDPMQFLPAVLFAVLILQY